MMRKTIRWLLLVCILAINAGDTPASTTFTLAILGDIMLGRGVAQVYANGGWENAFAYLSPAIQQADLAIANLESPLSDSFAPSPPQNAEKDYNLCAPADGIRALQSAGLKAITLTNNHQKDCGEAGLGETTNLLHKAGLMPVVETDNPAWLSVNGQRIALFALNDITKSLNIETTEKAIRQAKKKGGWVVVSIHWGMEYHPGIDSRQQKLAQDLADAGADLIIGHHPHVLQKIAWVKGKERRMPTLVAYSLGNALFDQPMPDTRRSVVLFVSVNSYGIQNWWGLPFRIDPHRAMLAAAEKADLPFTCSRLSGKPIDSICETKLISP